MTMPKGTKLTQEHKDKISKSITGLKRGPMSEELKIKLSEAHKGQTPWNKGRKEIRPEVLKKLSDTAIGRQVWNAGTSRTNGITRQTKRINGKKKLLSHIIWCSQSENLPIVPNGMVIHHRDLNPMNNSINNLLMLDRSSHTELHNIISKEILNGNR